MSNTLQIAYKILYSLESGKHADFMGKLIGPDALGVEKEKWAEVLLTLKEEGYIAGVKVGENIIGETQIDVEHARITLKGAEYLHENSAMRKIGKVATNIFTLSK